MIQKVILSRSELHNLVWEHSLSYLTATYMVSYTSFKKICNENDLPLPPAG